MNDFEQYHQKGGEYVIPVAVFDDLLEEYNELKNSITITPKEGGTNLRIPKGMPHISLLYGIEMIIEVVLKETNLNVSIDELLADVKELYIRDNGGENGN